MAEEHAKGITVTFTPVYKSRFLFVQRQLSDEVLGGYWCFPGGKVHVGETLAVAMVRELEEETGLLPTGRTFFVDSYLLGDRVGAHFAVEVTNDYVALRELNAHAWVKTVKELSAFSPRVAGIENHLHYITTRLKALRELAQLTPAYRDALHQIGWQKLEDYDLIDRRFLVKNA